MTSKKHCACGGSSMNARRVFMLVLMVATVCLIGAGVGVAVEVNVGFSKQN